MNRFPSGVKLFRWLFVVAMVVSPFVASAQIKTTHISDGYPNLGQGIRPLGMGNAFLTMEGTDENALFYNPAALQDFDKNARYSISLIPGVSVNKRLYTTVKDVFDLADSLDAAATTNAKIQAFENDFFNKHVGEFHSVRLRWPLFTMLRKGWGVGLLIDSRTAVSLRNRAFPNFELRTRNDGAVVLAKSVGLLGNDLSVGVLVKGIYRLYRDRIIVTNDIISSSLGSVIGFKQWGRAFGVGGDVGVRYKLPVGGLNPAIAVTYQDIGRTRFFGSDTDDNPQSLNAGAGIHPTLGDFEASIEVAATQLTQRKDLLTRVHGGAELRFPWMGPMRWSVRGGANQGYPTGGVSIDFKRARLDTAFFGEEVGETSRQGKIYKFAAELSVNF